MSEAQKNLRFLNVQHNSLKGQSNSFEEFFNYYKTDSGASELKLRKQAIETLFEKFNYVHDRVDELDCSEASKGQQFSI